MRVEGQGSTGRASDPGAPLLFLTFARSKEPDTRLFEGVTVGRRLEDLDDDGLAELLARRLPYREQLGGGPLFPETRRGKKSGRR